jgi:hypothetical protein
MIVTNLRTSCYAMFAVCLLVGCHGLGTEEKTSQEKSAIASNEMVYVSHAAGIAAFEVNPADGSLNQVDFLALQESAMGLQVTPDGRFLFATLSERSMDKFNRFASFIPLKGDGRFAGQPTKVLRHEGYVQLALSQDGRFLITSTTDGMEPTDGIHNYSQALRTYKIIYSEDSASATFAHEHDVPLESGRWWDETFFIGKTFHAAESNFFVTYTMTWAFYQDTVVASSFYDVDDEGNISQSTRKMPSDWANAVSVHDDYVFGMNYNPWGNVLGTFEVPPGQQARLLWRCGPDIGTPEHYLWTFGPDECRISAFAISPSDDRFFSATPEGAYSEDQPKLWFHPFTFQQGMDLARGKSINVPYYPESLTLSSKGSVLIGMETWTHYRANTQIAEGQLFVYRIDPATGELSPVLSQAPLPAGVFSIATR